MNFIKTYPRLLTLVLTYIAAFTLVHLEILPRSNTFIFFDKHVDLLLAGIMYSFGFTAAFGTAMLYTMPIDGNLAYYALIAATGSLATDLVLFLLFRSYFTKEVRLLFQSRLFLKLRSKISYRVKKTLALLFGAFCIASPLPDEIGVFILSTFTNVKEKKFALISFGLNYLGIFTILLLR